MKILLAVSGGIDSMTMAHLAPGLFRESAFSVAPCNFGLRGEESDGDETFVRQWCAGRGIECLVKRFDTQGYARSKGISIEMAARELRYEWFGQLCREKGFDAVAVAHNADDNAETLLLNITRGTGGRGLRGMGSHGLILRPLLGWTREEIQAWADANGVSYRVDSTNSDTRYKRNLIRQEVIPALKRINPSFIRTINREMKHFAQLSDIADDYFDSCGIAPDATEVRLGKLLGLKHWQYVLYRVTERCSLDADTVDALVQLRADKQKGTFSGKTFLSPTHRIVTSADSLTILPLSPETELPPLEIRGDGCYGFGTSTLKVKTVPRSGIPSLKQPEGTLIWDAEALPFPFTLRRWRDGDWFVPFGMRGRKKLSDFFNDQGWSLPMKENAVVIVADPSDSHVLAVAGARMDDSLKVKDSTDTVTVTELA